MAKKQHNLPGRVEEKDKTFRGLGIELFFGAMQGLQDQGVFKWASQK